MSGSSTDKLEKLFFTNLASRLCNEKMGRVAWRQCNTRNTVGWNMSKLRGSIPGVKNKYNLCDVRRHLPEIKLKRTDCDKSAKAQRFEKD